ncbi:hypothetical protein V6N13_021426 [Hibiscus sabdariffa]
MAELSPLFPLLILIFSIFIWLKLAKRNNLKLPPSPPKLRSSATSTNSANFPTDPSETSRGTMALSCFYDWGIN